MYYKNKKTENIYKICEIKYINRDIKRLLCDLLRVGDIEIVAE